MIFHLTLIFSCQLIGEMFVKTTGLPVPGPVAGMALLFVGLIVKGSIPKDMATVADTLISNLSLLFVPAGVGIMLHAKLIGDELLPISVALLISTVLTIAVSGKLMSWLGPKDTKPSPPGPAEPNP